MQNSSESPERIPREVIHNQNERLTTKHIQTLSFLQDIAKENKALKAQVEQLQRQQEECVTLHSVAEDTQNRIKEIQETYLARGDEINSMLAEKHKNEILQLVDENVEVEKKYYEEINGLKLEIQNLQQDNAELLFQLENIPQGDDQTEEKLQAAEREIKRLKSDYEQLRKLSDSQGEDLHKMNELYNMNHGLKQRVKETCQLNDELVMKVNRLEESVLEAESTKELVSLIVTMKKKIEKMVMEREECRIHQDEMKKQIGDLNSETDRLKFQLGQGFKEQEWLTMELHKAHEELESLRKQLCHYSDKRTFKDFVTIKRELNMLKDENEILKCTTKLPSLLVLKHDMQSVSKRSGNRLPTKSKSCYSNCDEKKILALPSSGS